MIPAGAGDITWNTGRIGDSTTEPMTFTGPLVVSNGTWTSTLGYAASAFRADGGTLVLSGALSAADGAALGFNFTERAVAPMLVVPSVTADGAVVVRISSKGVWRPDYGADGKYVLTTSNGSFVGANVSLADDVPTWVKGVSVVDGEIVLDIKQKGMSFLIR